MSRNFFPTPQRLCRFQTGWLLLVLLCVSGEPHCAPAGNDSEPPKARVTVARKCENGVTRFLVENRELGEVTVTFDFELSNLKGTVNFPYTATFPPQETTEAFSLSPAESGRPWGYSYTNFFKLGSAVAVHDDSLAYSLPFAPGKSFRVSQGYGGKFSHHGANHYAIDWRMPVGTPVHAARGGLVVKVRDDSDRGGADSRFERDNNYMLIRHSDGTLAQYCHLRKNGACAQEGDVVREGDLVALSGNTGFSSGPHLHFAVYRARNGRERETLPVKFRTAEGSIATLKSGRSYTAQTVPPSELPVRVQAPGMSSGT